MSFKVILQLSGAWPWMEIQVSIQMHFCMQFLYMYQMQVCKPIPERNSCPACLWVRFNVVLTAFWYSRHFVHHIRMCIYISEQLRRI